MPIVNMPLEMLLRLVNAEREVLDESQIAATLHDMGVEVDEMASTQVYACAVCENVIERAAAQGEPLHCSKCGTDFRQGPDACRSLGESKVARLDMLAVRPDLFDPGGMARALRGFLGLRSGLIEYCVAPPKLSVRVDPKLRRDESYRPCIACAVVRDVRLDHERIKLLMNLQEDLHWALGRDRKLASIGVYDLDTLRGQRLTYEAVAPDGLTFVPLGFSQDDPSHRMTPAAILERHPTGRAYAHLLAGMSAYPMLRDADGGVLSMPPIINSENTRLTRKTGNLFVDVTGLSQRTVDRALNILLAGLKEVAPELQLEAVTIEYADGHCVTPDFTPSILTLDVRTAAETIGIEIDAPRLCELLERMGHGVAPSRDGQCLQVRVPAWRNDVMHPVDLIEDAAIAYGYDRLRPQLVPTFTVGAPRVIEEWSAVARRVWAGLGFHQVITLTLTNEAAAFEKWGLPADERAVRIENPISSEQTLCRVSLLPGLLETLSINKQYDLPQQLFEVGDCCLVDPAAETGAREERFVAAAMIGTRVGYADIRALADAFVHEMGVAYEVRPTEHPGFIPGRVAALFATGGSSAAPLGGGSQPIGTMGEVHPAVLERYGLRHPVAALEMSLARLSVE